MVAGSVNHGTDNHGHHQFIQMHQQGHLRRSTKSEAASAKIDAASAFEIDAALPQDAELN